MFHLAHFNEAKELVHLIVEASRPNLTLQQSTNTAASPFVLSGGTEHDVSFFSGPLTLSSTISMEKSFPSPRELLHVLMLLLLVMRARIVHLSKPQNTDDYFTQICLFFATQSLHHSESEMDCLVAFPRFSKLCQT